MVKRYIKLSILCFLTLVTIYFKLNAYFDHDDDRYGYGHYGEPYNPTVMGDMPDSGADIWHNLVTGPDSNNPEPKNKLDRENSEYIRSKRDTSDKP